MAESAGKGGLSEFTNNKNNFQQQYLILFLTLFHPQ